MLAEKEYDKIYKMLDEVNPLPYDCGSLCGSICCSKEPFTGDDDYIYLLPGEREYIEHAGYDMLVERQSRKDHYLPRSWGKYVYIVRCPGRCNRRQRPIQCRTFPLTPHIGKTGRLEMIYYPEEIPYSCPLIRERMTLSEEFERTTLRAWELLITDSAIRDLVIMDSKDREPLLNR